MTPWTAGNRGTRRITYFEWHMKPGTRYGIVVSAFFCCKAGIQLIDVCVPVFLLQGITLLPVISFLLVPSLSVAALITSLAVSHRPPLIIGSPHSIGSRVKIPWQLHILIPRSDKLRSQGRQTLLIFWWKNMYNRVVLVCTVKVCIPASLGRRGQFSGTRHCRYLQNCTHFTYSLRTDSYILYCIVLKGLTANSQVPGTTGTYKIVLTLFTVWGLILTYCIVLYWRGGHWCPMHCDLFEICCAPRICRLNFAQRPIFLGLRFFNEPEISDSKSPA